MSFNDTAPAIGPSLDRKVDFRLESKLRHFHRKKRIPAIWNKPWVTKSPHTQKSEYLIKEYALAGFSVTPSDVKNIAVRFYPREVHDGRVIGYGEQWVEYTRLKHLKKERVLLEQHARHLRFLTTKDYVSIDSTKQLRDYLCTAAMTVDRTARMSNGKHPLGYRDALHLPILAVAAKVTPGSHLAVIDIDVPKDEGLLYSTLRRRRKMLHRALINLVRRLDPEGRAIFYIEQNVTTLALHIIFHLGYDPSPTSMKRLARSIEDDLAKGYHVDVRFGGSSEKIVLPGICPRYAGGWATLDSLERGEGFRDPISGEHVIGLERLDLSIEDTFESLTLMRSTMTAAPDLVPYYDEPLPYRYEYTDKRNVMDPDHPALDMRAGGRYRPMYLLAIACVQNNLSQREFIQKVREHDRGSRDIASWVQRGVLDEKAGDFFEDVRRGLATNAPGYSSQVDRSSSDSVELPLIFDEDALPEDEASLLERMIEVYLERNPRLRGRGRGIRTMGLALARFIFSKKIHQERQGKSYVGPHAFLNGSVLLDSKTRERLARDIGVSREVMRISVKMLESMGVIGAKRLDPRHGRSFMYLGKLRFAQHYDVRLPSEALGVKASVERLMNLPMGLLERAMFGELHDQQRSYIERSSSNLDRDEYESTYRSSHHVRGDVHLRYRLINVQNILSNIPSYAKDESASNPTPPRGKYRMLRVRYPGNGPPGTR